MISNTVYRVFIFLALIFPCPHTISGEWTEGTLERNDGATRDYLNSAARLPWKNRLGDWIDAAGRPQGLVPFAVGEVDDSAKPQVVEFDLSELIRAWSSGAIHDNGIMLRVFTGKGSVRITSKDSPNRTRYPELLIRTKNKQHRFVATEDTILNGTTFKPLGRGKFLELNASTAALIKFDFGGLDFAKIHVAKLRIYAEKKFGVKGLQIGLFAVDTGGNDDEPIAEGRGIAIEYPGDSGIHQHESVYYSERFESDDWIKAWRGKLGAGNRLVSSKRSSGFIPLNGRALQATIHANGNHGLNVRYRFKQHQEFEPEEAFFRYYIRLEGGWMPGQGGKLPGFSGTYGKAGWGGRKNDGYNGWSARGSYFLAPPPGNPLAGRVPIGNYVYHVDAEGNYGSQSPWNKNTISILEPDRWYSIEQQIRLNTPGKNDGLLKAWVDGELVLSKSDFRFRDDAQLKIEDVWFNFYHGGTMPAPQDFTLYIDNLVIAEEYIGPMSAKH